MISPFQYQFNNYDVRVITLESKPWFLGSDICKILEIKNTGNAYSRLKSYEKTIRSMDGVSNPDTVWVSESGLYRLVMKSRKPEAEFFQDWVCQELLPTLRKDGAYLLPNKSMGSLLIEMGERMILLENRIEADEPYVKLAKAIEKSETSISVENFAKVLFQQGKVNIGRNRLYAWLRSHNYLMENNNPYQKFLEEGLFEIRQVPEKTRLYFETLITPQGQMQLVEPICNYFGTVDEPNLNVSEECKMLESQGDT